MSRLKDTRNEPPHSRYIKLTLELCEELMAEDAETNTYSLRMIRASLRDHVPKLMEMERLAAIADTAALRQEPGQHE